MSGELRKLTTDEIQPLKSAPRFDPNARPVAPIVYADPVTFVYWDDWHLATIQGHWLPPVGHKTTIEDPWETRSYPVMTVLKIETAPDFSSVWLEQLTGLDPKEP